ncbi:MAG TPA: tyrosine--tRNA ligase [Methylomirabilota bacterium]|nr:tyrosine--tRNA ligase [Methylomirabilota bacterium]
MPTSVLQDFQQRGLVADVTAPDELAGHLAEASRTIYVGFDPTADSLHIGSLVPLLALRRIQLAGHRPIVLVGGGTGLIGDPAGKTGERALNPTEQVTAWSERLKTQVRPFLDFEGPHAAVLVDNYEWLSRLELIPFLRDIGKHFGVGAMVARESVRARLASGLSFTEFSYQVLQAYDFLALSERHGCTVQMGGSDQWGNITAGTELIRRVRGASAYGLTMPLVAKADGTKFGKTESGTVWLDPARTSAYDMYQFWLNTSDADVVAFLKYFTFLSIEEIEELARQGAAVPEKRHAQRVLAREVTRLVHGDEALGEAERASQRAFDPDVSWVLDDDEGGVPGAVLPAAPQSRPIWRVLKDAGLVPSTSEARRLIQQGGVEVNSRRVADLSEVLPPGRYAIKIGRRRVYRVVIEG